jgi:hypothetical protein
LWRKEESACEDERLAAQAGDAQARRKRGQSPGGAKALADKAHASFLSTVTTWASIAGRYDDWPKATKIHE